MTAVLPHYRSLAWRAIRAQLRQPATIIPSLVFPLMFQGLTSAAMESSIRLPGFPEVDSFLQFAFTATLVQAAIFGSTAAGADLAVDIEGGFFERLIASPVRRTAIIAAQISSAGLLGFFQTWLFFGVSAMFGLRVESGLSGVLVLAVLSALLASAMGAFMVAFALKTGSTEAVQGSFPLLFIALFLSSTVFPRNLMEGWYKTVATINPLSHFVEGMRAQVITSFDPRGVANALAVVVPLLFLGVSVALLALRGRLKAR